MLRRMAIVPFEVCIAVLAILTGATGLLHYGLVDPVNDLLPMWEALVFNVVALLAGVWMLLGVATGLGRVEAIGLWLLNGTILGRFILYGHALGYGSKNFILTGFFDLAVIIASLVRLCSIKDRQVLIRTRMTDHE